MDSVFKIGDLVQKVLGSESSNSIGVVTKIVTTPIVSMSSYNDYVVFWTTKEGKTYFDVVPEFMLILAQENSEKKEAEKYKLLLSIF